MQTKKRAKPVKFGVKSKKDDPKDDSVKKVIEKVDEEIRKIEKSKDDVPPTEKKAVTEDDLVNKDDAPIDDSAPDTSDESLPDESEHIITDVSDSNQDVSDGSDEEKDISSKSLERQEKDNLEEKETVLNKDVTFFNVPPDGYNKKKSIIPYFFTVMFVTFLLSLAFFAGVYYAVKHNGIKLPALLGNTSKVPTVTPIDTPTPKPINLSKYNIQVLNGSGIAGEAAKLKTALTDAGFKVSSTGNAPNADFEKTEISTSKKVEKEYIDKLKELLSKSYVLGSTDSDATGEADVIITVGSSSAR